MTKVTMRKFIIREDTIKEVKEALRKYIARSDQECAGDNTGIACNCLTEKKMCSQWITDVLRDFTSGLCTLSPYMPSHLDLGNEECCGIFMGIAEDNSVICNECEMDINDALRQLKKGKNNE